MRVANVDVPRDGKCPGQLVYVSSPKAVCRRPSRVACSSFFFQTHGLSFTQVRGTARGWQVCIKKILLTSSERIFWADMKSDGKNREESS